MDPAFLDLPGEVIRLSMRTHQKYFAVRDPKTQEARAAFHGGGERRSQGWRQGDRGGQCARACRRGSTMRGSSGRRIRKRRSSLKSAKRSWRRSSSTRSSAAVWDKVERVKALAVELCAVTGADPKLVARRGRALQNGFGDGNRRRISGTARPDRARTLFGAQIPLPPRRRRRRDAAEEVHALLVKEATWQAYRQHRGPHLLSHRCAMTAPPRGGAKRRHRDRRSLPPARPE